MSEGGLQCHLLKDNEYFNQPMWQVEVNPDTQPAIDTYCGIPLPLKLRLKTAQLSLTARRLQGVCLHGNTVGGGIHARQLS